MTQQPIARLWINAIAQTTTGPLGQGVAVSVGMKTFGASAPLMELRQKFGFALDAVAAVAREQVAKAR